MVSQELVNLLQTKANYIIANYTETINNVSVKPFKDYTCIINNEINYQFQEATAFLIEANLLFGSATKNNDLEDKYSQNFVINIQSEINGGELAKKLFNLIFKDLTRTYQTLGGYKCKLFLTSPIITNPYNAIDSDFRTLMTMNGSIEMAEKVVLGSYYYFTENTTDIEVKPRQPYCIKEAVGGTDPQILNSGSPTLFTKSSDQITINMTLIYELDGTSPQTAHDTLFKKFLSECYGGTSNTYTFKIKVGDKTTPTDTKTISNLICVRGQHIYDETTGENVVNLQFKVSS